MPDVPRPTDSGTAGTPRWVKVFGAVLLALLLLVVAVVLLSGGEHGPGRHLSSVGLGTASSPAVAVAGDDRR